MATEQRERPRFFEQQFLGAKDLTAVVQYGRIARARHDLGAHIWGISTGLELVERASPSGSGQIEIFIQPGYAWDGFGRPIVVPAPIPLSPSLFRSIPFDAATASTGDLVDVWLRYRETPFGSPDAGFEICEAEDEYSRVLERVQVLVGPHDTHSAQHDPVTVGPRTVDAQEIIREFGDSTDPALEDESVPYQTFPDEWASARWLVPIGQVRWQPSAVATIAGSFLARSDDDLIMSARARRYAGVVAETVNAARGIIRLRSRTQPYTPTWSGGDPGESDALVWAEGSVRVSGDVRLLGSELVLRRSDNTDNSAPLTIRRIESNDAGGSDLHARIGEDENGLNRFVVGPLVGESGSETVSEGLVVLDSGRVGIGVSNPGLPLAIMAQGTNQALVEFRAPDDTRKWHLSQLYGGNPGLNFVESGVADGRLFLEAGGDVGIGTTSPTNALDVRGGTGIRHGALYVCGKPGWSHIAYNAHHNASANDWVFPDSSRPALAVALDDNDGSPRFSVFSTTSGDTTNWRSRFRVDGESGDVLLAYQGGRLGVGTTSPEATLHVRGHAAIGPLVPSSGEGRFEVSGDRAQLSFVRRNLASWPSTAAPGDRYAWYNPDGSARLWTEGNADLLTVSRDGRVGIGTTAPANPLHVVRTLSADQEISSSYVAHLKNTSTVDGSTSVLLLSMDVSEPDLSNNFIAFRDRDDIIGAVEGNDGGGVSFDTTGPDYAEWLRRADGDAPMEAGTVVGVNGGRVSRSTANAERVMAVSTAPGVLGNRPKDAERSLFEKVGFLGQVPVSVQGPVAVGDYLMPSDAGDGWGVARSPEDMAISDFGRAIGVAWEASDTPDQKKVLAAVGLPEARGWAAVASAIEDLQAEIKSLKSGTRKRTTKRKTATSKRKRS